MSARPLLRPFLCATAAAMLLAAPARGQQVVGIAATIPVPSPSGVGVRDLSFGQIALLAVPQNVTVAPQVNPQTATVYSAEFLGSPSGAAGVQVQVSVPSQLDAGTGSAPLAFSANGNYGAFCFSEGATPCALQIFNPVTSPTQWICKQRAGPSCNKAKVFLPGSEYHVYVGGQITVPPTAAEGTYTGTVTLTLLGVM